MGATELPNQPTTNGSTTHTAGLLIVFYTLAIVWGVRCIRYTEQSSLDLLVPLALAVSVGVWGLVDARRLGRVIPTLAKPWFILAPGVAVLIYIVWTRRWRGVVWIALHLAVWYAIVAAVFRIGWGIIHGRA